MKDGDIELLIEIAQFEDSHNMEEFKTGWSWRHVRVWPATLSRLFKDGYLENVFRSNSYTGYRLSELGRSIVNSSRQEDETASKPSEPMEITDNLFGDISGHDEIKELLKGMKPPKQPKEAKKEAEEKPRGKEEKGKKTGEEKPKGKEEREKKEAKKEKETAKAKATKK